MANVNNTGKTLSGENAKKMGEAFNKIDQTSRKDQSVKKPEVDKFAAAAESFGMSDAKGFSGRTMQQITAELGDLASKDPTTAGGVQWEKDIGEINSMINQAAGEDIAIQHENAAAVGDRNARIIAQTAQDMKNDPATQKDVKSLNEQGKDPTGVYGAELRALEQSSSPTDIGNAIGRLAAAYQEQYPGSDAGAYMHSIVPKGSLASQALEALNWPAPA